MAAWTQADVDSLRAALKDGVRTVQYSDGRLITYASLAEMLQLLGLMEATLADPTGAGGLRSTRAVYDGS